MAVNEHIPLNVMGNNDTMPYTISKTWQPDIVPEATLVTDSFNETFCQVWVENVDASSLPTGFTGVVVIWDGKSLHRSGVNAGKPLVSSLQFKGNSLSMQFMIKGLYVMDEGFDYNNVEIRSCPVLIAATASKLEPHIMVGGGFN